MIITLICIKSELIFLLAAKPKKICAWLCLSLYHGILFQLKRWLMKIARKVWFYKKNEMKRNESEPLLKNHRIRIWIQAYHHQNPDPTNSPRTPVSGSAIHIQYIHTCKMWMVKYNISLRNLNNLNRRVPHLFPNIWKPAYHGKIFTFVGKY